MFDVLIAQVRKIFSTKKNGGRLLYKQTDALHDYKQVLFAISIAILVAYSKFRKDFDCGGNAKVEQTYLSNFCWINGTMTQAARWASISEKGSTPHIGINFRLNEDRYVQINHNYMHSLWTLLVLMPLCSYLVQRKWASMFENETLIAILKLPGHKEMNVVKSAEKSRPYETLRNLPTKSDGAYGRNITTQQPNHSISINDKPTPQSYAIEILHGDSNDHNRALDYYVDQLICLLIAKRASAYRLSELGLRRKLIMQHLYSTLLTMMQFVIPWLFIGDEYTLYGWHYFNSWLKYVLNRLRGSQAHVNSIDYELSAYIWPTMAQCEYKTIDNHREGRFTVQCSIPINETCGKLFAVIWWFIAINIVIELYHLFSILLYSISYSMVRWCFGYKFWPHTIEHATSIATFRYRRHALLNGQQHLKPHEINPSIASSTKKQDSFTGNLSTSAGSENSQSETSKRAELSDQERKILEAQSQRSRSSSSLGEKKWYLWCSRDVGVFIVDKGKKVRRCNLVAPKKRTFKDEDGFREVEENLNVYYLLYLLHLRLNCSQRKVEHVIRATSKALNRYLDFLQQADSDVDTTEFFDTREMKSSENDVREDL